MAKSSGATRRSRAQWAELIRRWQSSGLSRTEFAARTGVDPGTLSWWRWRLGAEEVEGAASAPSVPKLARVILQTQAAVPGDQRADHGWELRTAQGHTLRVGVGVPPHELREVLAALLEPKR